MAFAWILALTLAAGSPPVVAPRSADVPAGRDEVVVGRYRLERRPAGEYEATTEVFTARITVDGAVTFKDRVRLPGPAVWPILMAAEILRETTSKQKNQPDPRGGASLRPSIERPTLTVSDEDLRRDPHHAAKMTFLESTAAFREGLRLANDRTALSAFEKRVHAAAVDPRRPPTQRRADLFDLWLDCDESPRGAPARAVVETVARQVFPPGSPTAYSAAELTGLNAGAPAGLRFSPYAPARKN